MHLQHFVVFLIKRVREVAMKLEYFGHSCFTLSSGGFTLAIDPYDDKVEGYPPLKISADKVFCSHDHFDHCYVQAVDTSNASSEDPFSVESFDIPHDDAGGAKRGMNKIRAFSAEGKKVIHFGDTGCMPSEELLEALKGADAILIPVGGFFTIDADQAKAIADVIEPKMVIPMHYRQGKVGIQQIAEPYDFISKCKNAPYTVKLMAYGEIIEI